MTSYFAPLRVEDAEPLSLDMQSLFPSGRFLPFGAKLSVTHVFRSSEVSPVEVKDRFLDLPARQTGGICQSFFVLRRAD